jgi:hypothetical protein
MCHFDLSRVIISFVFLFAAGPCAAVSKLLMSLSPSSLDPPSLHRQVMYIIALLLQIPS